MNASNTNASSGRAAAAGAVILQQDGRALPAAVTAEILAAAVAWGEAWLLFDRTIPDTRASAGAHAARDAAYQAAERRLLAALRPAVPGL